MPELSQTKIKHIQRLYVKQIPLTQIAERLYCSYSAVYNYTRLLERFKSLSDYKNYLAKKKGFESDYDYRKYRDRKKQKKRLYKRLSEMLRAEFEQREESYSWLAYRVGVSHTAVYLYVHGKSLPSQSVFRRMCSVLHWRYRTIDDLLAA